MRSSKPYHHGDLRAALVGAAFQVLERQGVEGLTLRGLTAAAGVSRAAPYAHFSDKRALLAAIAENGFSQLADEMTKCSTGAGSAHTRFVEIGRAYVRFALAHPNLYKLMFSAELGRIEDFPELQRTSERSYAAFKSGLEEYLQERGASGRDETTLRITVWSCVHGLAMLLLENRLPTSPERNMRLLDDVTLLIAETVGPPA